MAYTIRRSSDRQHFDYGWLNTFHTFSFGRYYDPKFMGFRDLRVINEDRVAPSAGFPAHSHSNMEIITIVLEGSLAHQDSTGTVSTIQAGQAQVMSAGTGMSHSEFNPSTTSPVHFLQIWIIPDTQERAPRYDQMTFPITPTNQKTVIASKDGKEGSLKIQQDVNLSLFTLNVGEKAVISQNRYVWIQVLEGELKVHNELLYAGDGISFDSHTPIEIEAQTASRFLFFDLK